MKKIITLLLLMVTPASAEKLSLDAVSSYFNKMTTAEAAFIQSNDDGSQSAGRMYIKRPGRIRFEYDPPNLALVIVGGGQVAVFDPKANAEPIRFPLRQTPLSLVLESTVDLARRDMVLGHKSDGPRTIITLQDPDRAEYGYIQLVFTDDPMQLRQWIVDDNSGNKTQIVLRDWIQDQKMPSILFNIQAEMQKRAN
ncbi:MAG: outer membrane lipoprotein carrier protein LolA [Planktomarina sp.]|jgi:outer membrane lipoprotein-sorting protein|nr:outer membrane lipoprotein carrier protein LolA [Planktomarina sp.]